MTSLIKKTIRGKPYYYARECKRVNGRPKIVWQKYLGRAEDIVTALSAEHSESAPVAKPTEAAVSEFGAVVALGYPDPSSPTNEYRSPRDDTETFVRWLGFD